MSIKDTNEEFRALSSTANNTEEDETEIDLMEIFYLLKQHLLSICVSLLTGAVIAFLVTFFLITPMYTATAKMYVIGSNSVLDLSALQIGSQLTSDYQELLTSRTLLEGVIEDLGLDSGDDEMTYESLSELITISNPDDTRVIEVSVTTDDPQLSADIANTLADNSTSYLAKTMNSDEPVVYEDAVVPTEKSSPSYSKNVAIGGFAGVFLCVAYLVVRFLMNDTFVTPTDINKYFGVQPLASIPEHKIKGFTDDRG